MQLSITLDGKTYYAPKPKVKLWKEVTKLKESNLDIAYVMDDVVGLIVSTFNHPEVTVESIEENMDLADLIPFFNQMVEWINKKVMEKMGQLPNVQNPATN